MIKIGKYYPFQELFQCRGCMVSGNALLVTNTHNNKEVAHCERDTCSYNLHLRAFKCLITGFNKAKTNCLMFIHVNVRERVEASKEDVVNKDI